MTVRAGRPLTAIEPSRGLFDIDLRELWRYRELLYFFVWRDVKIRYRQTAFGVGWAVLQPFLLMVVFSFVLGRLARVPSDDLPYPVFAYSALVPWSLFSQALAGASNSLVESANLVTKTYFPRVILPIATAASHLIDFLVAMALVVGMMLFYGLRPTAAVLLMPFLTVAALVAALAVGIWLSAINVKYRDVRHAIPFIVQLWFFATPVAYPSSLVPVKWRVLVGLNPMAGIVEGFRWALIDGPSPGAMLPVSIGVSLVALVVGIVYFQRAARVFADWI